MWLIVGLGNPGSQYDGNRHNLGFLVVDELCRRAGAPAPRRKLGADVTEARIAGEKAIFCKPMEFMNTSGQAVARVARFWKLDPAQTVIVHDDLDLPFAQLKLAQGGGHGGHNGLRSIIADWGTADFLRVRVGIGRPQPGRDPVDYVLADFSHAEQAEVASAVSQTADAVETIIASGLGAAMNRFNVRKKPPKQ